LPPALEAHLAGSTDLDASPGPEQLAALAPRGPQTVLRARGLAAGWAGQAIVNGVDLELRPGEIVTLAGRNGAGKSTLLATLAGLVPPVAGKVEMAPAAALRECVSCVLQFADRLFYRARVRSELEEWAPPPAVAAALAVVGLSPAILEASPFRLSGGEARRLAIAAQIATRRPVLLLDEPGVGLDGPGLMMLAGLIRALAGAGQAVLVATHDPDLARLGSIRLELADGLLSSGR
jgi:energy-coupling factor transport system ATP-binding protein